MQFLAFCLFFTVVTTDYKQFFADGLAAYNNEDYNLAIDNMVKSYNLKKHSKTSYYIAISYFKMGEDSLAEKFAKRAITEMPVLADNPYQENINHIFRFRELSPRFKKLRFKFEMSDDEMTPAEKAEQKKIENELKWYYPETPEGQSSLFDDLKVVQSRSLPNENESKLNTTTYQFYREPIIDGLE